MQSCCQGWNRGFLVSPPKNMAQDFPNACRLALLQSDYEFGYGGLGLNAANRWLLILRRRFQQLHYPLGVQVFHLPPIFRPILVFICILLLSDQSVKNLVIGGLNTSALKSLDLNLTILKELNLIPTPRHVHDNHERIPDMLQAIPDLGCFESIQELEHFA